MKDRITKKDQEPKSQGPPEDIIGKLPSKEKETLTNGTVLEKLFEMRQEGAIPYSFSLRTIRTQISNLSDKADAIVPGAEPLSKDYDEDREGGRLFDFEHDRWLNLVARKEVINAHAAVFESARVEAEKL